MLKERQHLSQSIDSAGSPLRAQRLAARLWAAQDDAQGKAASCAAAQGEAAFTAFSRIPAHFREVSAEQSVRRERRKEIHVKHGCDNCRDRFYGRRCQPPPRRFLYT